METSKDTTTIIQEAADAIRAGELVIFPTDTVYGIGCDPFNEDSLERLRIIKKRPDSKHFPVLVDSIATAEQLGVVHDDTKALLEQHWPGALTVVVEQTAPFPLSLTGNGQIGLRQPNHEDLLELITHVGGALASTSANLSSKPALTTYDEVYAQFSDIIPVIIPGVVREGVPSTVADCTQSPPTILRQGGVSLG